MHSAIQAMKISLISYTANPEELIAKAARVCYASSGKDTSGLIRMLLEREHLSPFEHATFTFEISGISRACLAQLTRHRIASFSVESQRYVEQDGGSGYNYVVPDAVTGLDDNDILEFHQDMDDIYSKYTKWKKMDIEDARCFLPNACTTHLIMTMNARELLHFIALRSCAKAQDEIRELAREIKFLCEEVAPTIFENAGPKCTQPGGCKEFDLNKCPKEFLR